MQEVDDSPATPPPSTSPPAGGIAVSALVSVLLGAGCFVLSRAIGRGAAWPTWLTTTSVAAFALGWWWPSRGVWLAALLVVTQPLCVYIVNLASGEIQHPSRSTGGMAGVCIGSCIMLMCTPLPLFTAFIGARIGSVGRSVRPSRRGRP